MANISPDHFLKTKWHASDLLSSSVLIFCFTLLAVSTTEKTSLAQNRFSTHLTVRCWMMEKQLNQRLELNGSSEYRNAVYYFKRVALALSISGHHFKKETAHKAGY